MKQKTDDNFALNEIIRFFEKVNKNLAEIKVINPIKIKSIIGDTSLSKNIPENEKDTQLAINFRGGVIVSRLINLLTITYHNGENVKNTKSLNYYGTNGAEIPITPNDGIYINERTQLNINSTQSNRYSSNVDPYRELVNREIESMLANSNIPSPVTSEKQSYKRAALKKYSRLEVIKAINNKDYSKYSKKLLEKIITHEYINNNFDIRSFSSLYSSLHNYIYEIISYNINFHPKSTTATRTRHEIISTFSNVYKKNTRDIGNIASDITKKIIDNFSKKYELVIDNELLLSLIYNNEINKYISFEEFIKITNNKSIDLIKSEKFRNAIKLSQQKFNIYNKEWEMMMSMGERMF